MAPAQFSGPRLPRPAAGAANPRAQPLVPPAGAEGGAPRGTL